MHICKEWVLESILSLQFFFCLRFSDSFVIFDCFFCRRFNDVILSFVRACF